MAKIRVYELAKAMGVPAAQLLEELRALGVQVRSNLSILDESALLQIAGPPPQPEPEEVEEAVLQEEEEAPLEEDGGDNPADAELPVEAAAEADLAEEDQEEDAEEAEAAGEVQAEAESEEEEAEAEAEAPQASLTPSEEAQEPPEVSPEKALPSGEEAEPAPSEREESQKALVEPPKGEIEPRRVERPRRRRQAPPAKGKESPRKAEGEDAQVGHAPAKPAAAPKAPPVHKPSARAKPKQEVRRRTKRERRIEKLQAKVDRREKLEQELEKAQAQAEGGEAVFIREGITVKELAEKLNVKVKDIIGKLMMRGILATINQSLDGQVAIQISSMFGFSAEIISYEDELVLTQEDVPEDQKVPRAPVVTVMGHVDHGKSSILEAIHHVDITGGEHGGITQHIGAYKVRHEGKEYIFLDTPGHEAFTLMRARGAQVTDVVILVVAADDGVMPQTIEAINHCKAANVPMVVAINKMDKQGADPEKVKKELSQHGVQVEDWGGDVVSVPVSAKSGLGIEEMLEMVSLVADMLDLTAAPDQPASGTVLESRLDRARGPVATVLIQDGTLRVGDLFLCGTTYGHVRSLLDEKGRQLEKAPPSTPVEVLGFPEVPAVGSLFQGMTDEAKARQVASFRKEREKARSLRRKKVSLDNVLGAIEEGKVQNLSVVLKADVQGSLEAISQQLAELSTEEVAVEVVHKGVGAVSESDVILASASNGVVIGFNVRPEKKATELAKAEEVDITLFTVIYDLVDRMKQSLSGMLKPKEEEVVLGQAEVKQIFRVSKVGTIAGCLVTEGRIKQASPVRVLRDNVVVHTGVIQSLKRFKDDAAEVKEGVECGIGVENFNDIKPGDVLEAYEVVYRERTL